MTSIKTAWSTCTSALFRVSRKRRRAIKLKRLDCAVYGAKNKVVLQLSLHTVRERFKRQRMTDFNSTAPPGAWVQAQRHAGRPNARKFKGTRALEHKQNSHKKPSRRPFGLRSMRRSSISTNVLFKTNSTPRCRVFMTNARGRSRKGLLWLTRFFFRYNHNRTGC